MNEKMGIKELKELLAFVMDTVEVGVLAAKDKKIDLNDLGLLLRLIPSIGPAFQDVKGIVPEVKDLDAAEVAELIAFVMSRLTVEEGKARVIVEKSLIVAAKAFDLGMASVELYKAIKA